MKSPNLYLVSGENEPTQRDIRKYLIAGGGVLALSIMAGIGINRMFDDAERHLTREPEMVIDGTFTDDGELVTTTSNVTFYCNEKGVQDAFVRADSRTVTDRAGGAPRGRNIISRFNPGVDSCEEALDIVRSNPQEIYLRIKDNVTGYVPDISDDGTYHAGDIFSAVAEEAIAAGIPVYHFEN